MWTLLLGRLSLLRLGVTDKLDQLRSLEALKADFEQSKRMLDDISQAMVKMTQMGHQDTPEFHRVAASYQKLSHLVSQVAKQIKDFQVQESHQIRGTQPLPSAVDLQGVLPIKGTLGPVGTPGMTSRGTEVANLQKFLSALGFPASTSGEFDIKTRVAVQQFQTKYKLQVTGTLGAETRKVMNDLIKGAQASPGAALEGPAAETP